MSKNTECSFLSPCYEVDCSVPQGSCWDQSSLWRIDKTLSTSLISISCGHTSKLTIHSYVRHTLTTRRLRRARSTFRLCDRRVQLMRFSPSSMRPRRRRFGSVRWWTWTDCMTRIGMSRSTGRFFLPSLSFVISACTSTMNCRYEAACEQNRSDLLFHLRRLREIRRRIGRNLTVRLILAFITTRLDDYCNSVLLGVYTFRSSDRPVGRTAHICQSNHCDLYMTAAAM